MANNPTIVSASLSDKELQDSINKMVANFDKGLQTMLEHSNEYVGKIQASLQKIGNTNFGAKGSNDGGVAKQTKQHKDLTEAVTKETQKLQDLQQSLSGASDREHNFISQKERAANTIAQENELLQRQETELAQLKTQQQQFADAERSSIESKEKNAASVERLRGRLATYEQELERVKNALASSEQGVTKYYDALERARQRIASKITNPNPYESTGGYAGATSARDVDSLVESLSRLKYATQRSDFLDALRHSAAEFFSTTKDSLDASKTKVEDFQTKIKVLQEILKSTHGKELRSEIQGQIQSAKDLLAVYKDIYAAQKQYQQEVGKSGAIEPHRVDSWKREEKDLKESIAQTKQEIEKEAQATQQSTQASQQKAQIDAQIAAKEKEIAETKGRIAAATKEQSEADKNASQAAKEKANIQSQVANQEKQVAEAKKQLATATRQQSEVEKQSVQNIAQQTAARDKQIKKNQEAATSFDNFAKAQQVAIRSASPSGIRNAEELQTMNIQLDLLRERLREARQQYSSFVALAAHATTTGDKGLFQYATDGVHKYEQEVRSLIPQIRTLQSGIQQMGDVIAPQGHTIQNYINSLQKANPELAALNAQYKSGASLLQTLSSTQIEAMSAQKKNEQITENQKTAYQQATAAAKEYSEQVKQIAAEIRQSAQWQKEDKFGFRRGMVSLEGRPYPVSENLSMGLRLEDQIVSVLQRANEERQKGVQTTQQQAQASQRLSEEDRKAAEQLGWIEEKRAKRRYISPSMEEVSQIRAALQSVTGQQEKWVDDIDKTKASYNQLSQYLKELKTIHADIWRYPKNANAAKVIAQEIQTVQREMQKWQLTMSRPISLKDAMGLSEKTLDDIAYKMRQLASYRSGLDVNAQHNEIRRVNYEYDVLKKKMDEVMQKNSQMISSNTALGRSWNYMKNRLAFYFTVGASTQFVKNLIEVRSQYEMNERALGILVDSAERGTQIFRELSDMALVSPYTLIELSSAAKQLTAYDVAAKDVVDTTRRLADMASAVGVPVERLTYALGQIKAYGYLNSRDARMFANAGIPLVKELADHYTRLEGRLVSTADIYDRIKKKAIDYNDVMQVMNEMTDEGGKFYDFQAKMADTLKVQLANLTLAWNNMLNDLGNSQQGLLTSGIGALKELFLHWKDLDRILTNLAVTIGTAKAAQLLLNMSFGKGTLAAIKNISAIEGNTAAMYENALSKSNLSKAEARWLISTNKSNVALRAAMVNMKLLTVEEANAAASTTVLGVRMGWLGRVMKTNFFGLASVVRGAAVGMEMLGKAMLSIVTNPVFLSITAAMALVDALLYYNQIAEKTAEMNKAIADNAKEASEAIGDYLKDSVNIGNRAKAVQGVLSVSEGQKAWESIREQIELSSDAASVFISKLLEEEDINKRVKEGFDVAESIREATNAMAGLNAEAIKVSQDSWLWGAFGEGLAEDLEDYIEKVQEGRKIGANIGSKYFAAAEFNEAKRELEVFANDTETIIRDRLGAGVNDAVQLKEAIERIKKEVISANPQIKGEVKKWFDVEVDRMMAERFGNVYNELSSIQSQFIEHIKHDYGAALRRLSDDVLDTSKKLDDEVLSAISKAWDKLKDELPAKSQDLISKLQKQMDENPLTLRVLLLQAGEQQIRDAIQKDYEQHFYDSNIGEKPTRPKDVGSLWGDYKGDYKAFAAAQEKHEKEMVEYNQKNAEWEAKRAEYVAKYGDFNKKNDETRAKWAKRVNDEIKAADAEEKAAKHARESLEAELSLEERKTDARYLSAVQEEQAAKDRKSAAQEAWNYEKLYQEEKGKGRSGSKKDPLLDALKQEISLVEKLQSDYDKLTKGSASQAEALETIRGAYGKTIRLLNAQLGKYGLPQLDISQLITGKDPNKTLAHFKQTLDTLVSKGMLTLERSKELEAVVEKFTLSAKTYNLDMITKGLNNELGKLKDEYELAVELDANPELGDMFADMFGINTSTLPKTFGDALDRAQIIINRKLAEMNIATPFDLMEGNIDSFAKSTGLDRESAVIKELVAAQSSYRDMFKKNITETEKVLDDYIKKYGDYSDKIAEIEASRLEKLKKLNEAYYTEEMRKRPEYVAKLNAIEQGAKKEKQQVDFDEFKNSRYYTMMFENLDYISTKTIRDMRDRVRELMDTMNDLTPEQLKTLISQYEKLEQKLVKRSPFKTLTKDLKEYFATTKERKAANIEFKNAQKEYDVQRKNVAALKEKYEQEKANSNTSQSRLDFLQIEIDGENDILKILKEQLDAAQKKADKYNLTAKLAKSEALAVAQVVGQNLQSLGELRDFLQQDLGVELSDELNGLVDGLSKVGQGINKITSSATSGDIVGVITGVGQTFYGLYDGIASIFGGGSAGDKKIVRQIEESEKAVKRLELAYIDLEHAVNEAYGMATIGANMAAKANKELQLVELKRQLALERSRDSKHRDEDRIIDLQKQIKELEYDIADTVDSIVNDLLGISSIGDAMENMMDAFIEALRSGEDAMATFDESVDEMIANMVKKMFTTKILQPWFEEQWNKIQDQINERAGKLPDELAKVQSKVSEAKMADLNDNDSLVEALRALGMDDGQIHSLIWFNEFGQYDHGRDSNARLRAAYEKLLKEAEQKESELQKELATATMPTTDDIRQYAELLRSGQPIMEENMQEVANFLRELGLIKDDANKNLSALQQGIQGITEDTAGALEAITNGISQQCYLQSDILIQIRDTVQSFDIDIQTASLSQILLQLQSSYQLQQSMLLTMENWTNPSGQAVRVELVS